MKKKNKILLTAAIVSAIIIGGAFIFIRSISHGGLPDYNKDIKLSGLTEDVQVYRDKYGIPHIFAKNDEDLYRATGYLTAQDRLWQIDLLRRITQGRLSEIFGEDMINNDMILRALRIPEKSTQILENLNSELKKSLTAFAAGVNQYIKENSDDLPFEFTVIGYKPEKWKPQHSVNLLGYMAWSLEMGWTMESVLFKLQNTLSEEKFKELLPDLSLQKNPIFPDFNLQGELDDTTLLSDIAKIAEISPDIFNGSNNWAVSGKKSTTGKPIFANDMHLGLMIPGVWSQIHQHVEGGIDVTGVILPGQPFIIAGHNKDISWGMTNVMLDGEDFYIEKINPDNPNQYKYNGEWKDMEVRKIKIKVKDKEEVVEREIRFTHRGPVISGFKEIKDKVVSMRWIGNEPSNELRAVYLLNRAKNWKDFRNAVTSFVSVSQNIAYADKEGNIGLQTCAGIPIRTAPGHTFYPGETDEYDWKGLVPFDSLPYSYNPECGYVYSANNKTVPDSYPHYISAWFDLPDRSDRIIEMLTEKEKLSVKDFKLIQTDQKSKLVENMKPVILKHIKELKDFNSDEEKALKILTDWDNVLSVESVAAVIFEEFYLVLADNILSDEMSDELYNEFRKEDMLTGYVIEKIIKTGKSLLCDDVNTEKKEVFKDMVQKSFKQTVKELTEEYGAVDKTKWGDIHKLNLQQPLGKVKILDLAFNLNREYPAGGSYHTISPYSYSFNEPFAANHGASHRHIYNTANYDESFSIIPTGVSGIPASKHYCDQSEMYVNGKYHEDYVSREIVEKKAVYRMVFSSTL